MSQSGSPADSCAAAKWSLFDHVVGVREQRVRRFQAQRAGGREVEHELELGRCRIGMSDTHQTLGSSDRATKIIPP